jgi:hypothetical protein
MSYMARVKPSIVKLCHQSGMAGSMHAVSPTSLIIYRKVYNDWKGVVYPELPEYAAPQPWWLDGYGHDPKNWPVAWPDYRVMPWGEEKARVAATGFVGFMLPEIREIRAALPADRPFAVEGLNETIATGALEDIRRVVLFEAAVARALVALEMHVVGCILNPGVGNPQHGEETAMLVPAVRAAVETGSFIGVHAYWPSDQNRTWLVTDWRHYAGRWATSWDETFRAYGLRPHYIITECGPIGGPQPPWHLAAHSGWRSPDCLNGDFNRCMDEMLLFDQLSHQSVPGQEGRYAGAAHYCVAGSGEWNDFKFRAPEFDALAAAQGY